MEYHDLHAWHTVWGGLRWENQLRERLDNPLCLERHGYKVYSQNDEDGIIHEIFKRIGEKQRIFVEFGVEDGVESNTHYLLLKGWKGLWIEGSKRAVKKIHARFSEPVKNGALKVVHGFVTSENINGLVGSAGITGEIDLLSVDIDGNDYHVLNAITIINPRVIVAEYNGMLPPDFEWVMPYNPEHRWNKDDYYGASLLSFEKMLDKKGYALVGANVTGVNAFFVRKDLTGELFMAPGGGGGYRLKGAVQPFEAQRRLPLRACLPLVFERARGEKKSAKQVARAFSQRFVRRRLEIVRIYKTLQKIIF
jgi:hypothetical protein